MGQLVARLAHEQGHQIALKVSSELANRTAEYLATLLSGNDVAIDFSVAAAVSRNIEACALARVPLVEGTTGWHAELDGVRDLVAQHDSSLLYGANFSVGVQLFYRIASRAAQLFRDLDSYDAFIEEAHHKRKRDAPSGTALQLRELVQAGLGRDLTVVSTRAGYIPGTHRLGFDSQADQITISHEARNREGFAAGALLAAQWITGQRGMFEFSEVFDRILQERNSPS
jgi:4-hydroxy-tetrahydrodipicolinate reductase